MKQDVTKRMISEIACPMDAAATLSRLPTHVVLPLYLLTQYDLLIKAHNTIGLSNGIKVPPDLGPGLTTYNMSS